MVLSRSRIVIARSPKGDEAIHNFAPDMDCFAFARNDDLCSDLKSSRLTAEVHLSHLHRLSSGLKDEYSWIKWPAFHPQAGATCVLQSCSGGITHACGVVTDIFSPSSASALPVTQATAPA